MRGNPARNTLAGLLAASALAFYLPALTLPMLRIEKLGHLNEDSLFHGVISLLSKGYLFVGVIVLLFSIVLPLLKLVTIVLLCLKALRHSEHKAMAYHAVEFLGKWGMMDVMLVAILVAYVKLGDLVEIHAGTGIVAFAVMVLLSLISGLVFDPHMMWEEEPYDPERHS